MDSYELLQRIKDGDIDAFNELYDQFAKSLFFHIYEKTGNEARSLEIVRNTFATLYGEFLQNKGTDLAEDLLAIVADAQMQANESDNLEQRLGQIRSDIQDLTAPPAPDFARTAPGEGSIVQETPVNEYSFTEQTEPLAVKEGTGYTVWSDGVKLEAQIQASAQELHTDAQAFSDSINQEDASPDTFDTFFMIHEDDPLVTAEAQSGDVFGSVKIKRRSEKFTSRLLTIALCVLLVAALWFIAGQLMYLGLIPVVNLGYSLFNNIFGWYF